MSEPRRTRRSGPTRGDEPRLLAHHRELLDKSAIALDIRDERGYWSATERKQLERWFGGTQSKLVPALVIPTYDVRGEMVLCQLRPDEPRVVKGRTRKYEFPYGTTMALDVPPRVQPKLADPKKPLLITEGARKVDSAVSVGLNAIGVAGVNTGPGHEEDGPHVDQAA